MADEIQTQAALLLVQALETRKLINIDRVVAHCKANRLNAFDLACEIERIQTLLLDIDGDPVEAVCGQLCEVADALERHAEGGSACPR